MSSEDIPRSELCNACWERRGKARGGRQMICDVCWGAMHNNEDTPGPEEAEPEGEYPVLEHTDDELVQFEEDRYLLGRLLNGDQKVSIAPWIDDEDIPEDANYDSASPDTPVGHNWPNAETDIEEMKKWLDMVGEMKGWFPAARIREHDDRNEERLVLVDMDNVRHPETGEIHPKAAELIEQAGTYGQISHSGTGVHLYVRSTVPNGYSITVEEELSEWGYEAEAGGPPEIEVYPRSRFMALTGKHIDCTPIDVNPNEEFVHGLYEDYGTTKDPKDEVDPPEEWDPALSKTEVEEMDTTSNIEEIFDAVAHVDYGDFRLRSEQTQGGSSPTERKSFDPSWEHSESGTRLGHDDGGWIYRKGKIGLDSLQVVALEERIISDPRDYPSGQEYFEAVDALRNRGADIPEYEPPAEKRPSRDGPVVDRVLLPAINAATERIGWGMDDSRGGALPQSDVYDRTQRKIRRAMEDGKRWVVDGIMGCGKTYSSFSAAAELDEQLVYAAPRMDLCEQAVEYAKDNGYDSDDIYVMPGLFRDCPTACGDHGDSWEHRLRALRANGVNPKTMHGFYDDIPCEQDGDCEYRAKMQFDPDEYDVIIGHYAHLHLPQIVSGRHVVVDEEPFDAYTETVAGEQLITSINTFLGFDNSPPYDDFQDLLQNRHDPVKRKAAEHWFREYEHETGWDPDEQNALRFEDQNYHALTPKAIYAILFGEQINDSPDIYRATVGDEVENPVVFRDADGNGGYRVEVNTPPSDAFQYASSIIGLDGTPTKLPEDSKKAKLLTEVPKWKTALNVRFECVRVLTDEERYTFLTDTQNIHLLQTSQYRKPYSSGKHVSIEKDLALVEAAGQQFDYRPTVFSTKKARGLLEEAASRASIDTREWDHYGALRGSDEYGAHRLGVLLGSTHYGDEEIAIEAGLMGESIDPSGKGNERDYGTEAGNAVARAMTEANTAQAALRFGRDGNGAIVCIHTSAVPDWLPVHGKGQVLTTWSDGQRQAIQEIADGWSGSAAELSDRIGVGTRQCRNILNGLADRGAVERSRDPDDGRRYEWEATDLDALPVYGETSLPEVGDSAVGGEGEGPRIGYLREVSARSAFDHEVAVRDVPRRGIEVDNDTESASDTAVGD